MIKEVAFLFGWLFANIALSFYNKWLAGGIAALVIIWYIVI